MQRTGQACPGNQKKKKKEEKRKKKRKSKRQHPGKKKKRRKRQHPETRKKKKKAKYWTKPMCKCIWTFSSFIYQTPPTQFSPHFRENFLVNLRRKHLVPTNIFLSPSSNQTLSKKFSPLFFFLFFILPKIHSTKHTPNVKNAPM